MRLRLMSSSNQDVRWFFLSTSNNTSRVVEKALARQQLALKPRGFAVALSASSAALHSQAELHAWAYERPRGASSPQLTIFGRVRSIVWISATKFADLFSQVCYYNTIVYLFTYLVNHRCLSRFNMAWKFALVLACSALLSGKIWINFIFLLIDRYSNYTWFYLVI